MKIQDIYITSMNWKKIPFLFEICITFIKFAAYNIVNQQTGQWSRKYLNSPLED